MLARSASCGLSTPASPIRRSPHGASARRAAATAAYLSTRIDQSLYPKLLQYRQIPLPSQIPRFLCAVHIAGSSIDCVPAGRGTARMCLAIITPALVLRHRAQGWMLPDVGNSQGDEKETARPQALRVHPSPSVASTRFARLSTARPPRRGSGRHSPIRGRSAAVRHHRPRGEAQKADAAFSK